MDSDDLKVNVPRRFEVLLKRRFDSNNAEQTEGMSIIPINCPVCEAFYCENGVCTRCPFNKFRGRITAGCVVWVRKALDEPLMFHIMYSYIFWNLKNNRKARKQIAMLRERAKELIVFV